MDTVIFDGRIISTDLFEQWADASDADVGQRPWVCQFCHLVNWAYTMSGTLRETCHKCSAHKVIGEEVNPS